jgi:hypothetical protein
VYVGSGWPVPRQQNSANWSLIAPLTNHQPFIIIAKDYKVLAFALFAAGEVQLCNEAIVELGMSEEAEAGVKYK